MLDNPPRTIVITGGTGSFGSAFARYVYRQHPSDHIRIVSRDEYKQQKLSEELPPGPRVTYILADVRDGERMRTALQDADAVVHAAALKTVPAGERHGHEFVQTNIAGTWNVINAALANGVLRTLLISSDKAVEPLNLYGKTKAVAEDLMTQANRIGQAQGCRFASVRGGNVWGSRGSVIEVWRRARADGRSVIVTEPTATRFHLPMDAWTAYVYRCLWHMHGGEVFAPKLDAWELGELAQAFSPGAWRASGARHGDKLHETLVNQYEAARALDVGWSYVIQPPGHLCDVWDYEPWEGDAVNWPAYSSNNARHLTRNDLEALCAE